MANGLPNLRELRTAAGLTQGQMAQVLCVSVAEYQAWELLADQGLALPKDARAQVTRILGNQGAGRFSQDALHPPADPPPARSIPRAPAPEEPAPEELSPIGAIIPPDELLSRRRLTDPASLDRRVQSPLDAAARQIAAVFLADVESSVPQWAIEGALQCALAETALRYPAQRGSDAHLGLMTILLKHLTDLLRGDRPGFPQHWSSSEVLARWQSAFGQYLRDGHKRASTMDDAAAIPILEAAPIDESSFELRLDKPGAWRRLPTGHPPSPTLYGVRIPSNVGPIPELRGKLAVADTELPSGWNASDSGALILVSLHCPGDESRITTWLGHLDSFAADEVILKQSKSGFVHWLIDPNSIIIHRVIGLAD